MAESYSEMCGYLPGWQEEAEECKVKFHLTCNLTPSHEGVWGNGNTTPHLHTFLTSVLDEGKRLASNSGRFIPEKQSR
jgi:hypothetical protein